MHRIAVLDDYQSAAAGFADWSLVPGPVDVVEFADHLGDEDALVDRLTPFEVVVAMRERTPFPRTLLERLPHLRLLVTTGRRNASIDVAAAAERGITVCGTGSHAAGPVELTWALILAVARQVPLEDASVRAGGWQETVGTDLAGATLGVLGLGRLGERVARIGSGLRHGRRGLESEPDRPARRRGRRPPGRQGRAVRDGRRPHRPPGALRPHPRARRPRRAGADEARRRSWSTPPAGRSSTRPRCWLRCAATGSPAPGLDVFDTEPLSTGPSAPQRAENRAHPAPRLRHGEDLRDLLPRGRRGRRRLPGRESDPRPSLNGAQRTGGCGKSACRSRT